MMDARAELQELIQQAREHLLYFRDLGLTNIGEETTPERMALSAIGSEEQAPAVLAPMVEQNNPEPKILTPPIQPEIIMKKESVPAATSLFLADDAVEPLIVTETLEDIRRDLGDCKRCKLWSTRTNIVFGEGNPNAELMFVGEAPGADEDASGRPFVGRAGQLLTKMIEAIEMKREDVYIANTLKSRPPGNRNPEPDETSACIPFVYRQIATIRPKLIVTLGNPATQGLLETKVGITRIRGTFQEYPRIAGIKVLPTYHPAYLLRSPDKKREAWEDLKKARAFLRGEI
ncbi:MAG TPA: uracil-DNA glycosylase [Blastocatellia bacterium]|nr:uracil-DNA glycosylase [Blastocatellia bacterium]